MRRFRGRCNVPSAVHPMARDSIVQDGPPIASSRSFWDHARPMATGLPDPSQGPPRIERGVLFADVSNSTRLFHELGDDRGRAIVVAALAFARQIVDSSRGRVVDSIGDELFCEFPDADAT